jgi:hypothetical protein
VLRPQVGNLILSLGHLICSSGVPKLFFSQFSSANQQEGIRDCVPLLSLLKDFYQSLVEPHRTIVTPTFLECLRALLDAASTEESFMMLLSILISIDHKGRRFVQPHLGDIVDCLLGWRLDSTSSPEAVALIDGSSVYPQCTKNILLTFSRHVCTSRIAFLLPTPMARPRKRGTFCFGSTYLRHAKAV